VKTRLIVCLACVAASGPANPARAADPAVAAAPVAPSTPDLSTPTSVWEALTDENLSFSPTDEQKATAIALIESAAKTEPKDARWVSAQGILHGRMGAKEKAVEFAEKAVKLDPKNARVQFWYGTALFENIENVGMFSKMGYAGDAEKAYLTAIELDPKYMSPHVGLVQFYANAPGIAGGSLKKARKHAQAVVEIGGRATSTGHSLLANIAAKDEDWDEAAKQHRLASETATTPKDKASALVNLGLMLVRERNDPEAALKVAEEARALVGAPDDSMADLVTGLAKQKQGKHAEAVPMFRSVIAKNPQAMNSRFALAECLEQTGDKAGAAAMFEEFAAKFPNDKRAEDAAKRAKKLRKAVAG
jgi:tetratricopeptide (TPR) repeat protein